MEIKKKEIIKICKIAWNAGDKILQIYKKKFRVFKKQDMSPVTTADLESEKIIIKGLREIFNNPKIVSEESNNKIKGKINNFWLVDPLDGTKEFIKKNGEFTVNIAFIKENKPIFGIIYAPELKKTYVGIKKNSYEILNKKKFKKIKLKKNYNKTMIISRSHSTKNEIKKLLKKYNIKKVLYLGSSLKFCYLAEGLAHVYPRSGTTYEWDTAAGHAIVNGVGGKVENNKGYVLKYGKKNFKNTSFVAKIF
tara:strand:- start:765 stop:1514 length:750 start_codon:yes stop_codon:yes gene_type:complete